jgi:hypothetical protein
MSEADAVTLGTLNRLMGEVKELRDKETRVNFEKKLITDELEAKEAALMEILVSNNMGSFRSPYGLASISKRLSVKTPKSEDDRKKFFEYLKEKGVYDHLITVNSMTLNSYYKEEFAAAEQRGDADTFTIPGITEVTIQPILSFRK